MPRKIPQILLLSLFLLLPSQAVFASGKAIPWQYNPSHIYQHNHTLEDLPRITNHVNGDKLVVDPLKGVKFEWSDAPSSNDEQWSVKVIFEILDKETFQNTEIFAIGMYGKPVYACSDQPDLINDGDTANSCHVPARVFNKGSITNVHVQTTKHVIATGKNYLFKRSYSFFPVFDESEEIEIARGQVIIQLKDQDQTSGRVYASQEDFLKGVGGHLLSISKLQPLFKDQILPPSAEDLKRLYVLDYFKPIDGKDFCQKAQQYITFEFCQPNYLFTVASTPDPFLSSEGSWGQPLADLWGLDKVVPVWNHTQGENVTVAVIDTGLDYHHPDIKDNVWMNPGEGLIPNGIDDDGNGLIDDIHGYDFSGCEDYGKLRKINDVGCVKQRNPSSDPMDYNGHGTHVAGVIAAVGNNGLGIVGVAPKAKVMPVKSFNSQGISDSVSLAKSIVYAAVNGADVINNSWSGTRAVNPVIELVTKKADEMGSVVIQSAGNDFGKDVRELMPQRLYETITVGAADFNGEIAPFSNVGSKVDVYAPGFEILSLNAQNSDNELANYFKANDQGSRIVHDDYLRLNGTSLASAHVSGITALLLANNPELSNDQIKALLSQSAINKHVHADRAFSLQPDGIEVVEASEDDTPFSSFNHEVVSIHNNFSRATGIDIYDIDLFSQIVFTPVVDHDNGSEEILKSVALDNSNDEGWGIIQDIGDKLSFESDGKTLYLYFFVAPTSENLFAEFLSKVNGYNYASTLHMIDPWETNSDIASTENRGTQSHTEEAAVNNLEPVLLDMPFGSDGADHAQIQIIPEDLGIYMDSFPSDADASEVAAFFEQLSLAIRSADAMETTDDALSRIRINEAAFPQITSPAREATLRHSEIEFRWSRGEKEYEHYLLVGTCRDLNPCMGNIFNQELGQDRSVIVPSVPLGGLDVFVKLAYRPVGEDGPWEYDLYTYQTLSRRESALTSLETRELFPITQPNIFSQQTPKAIPYSIFPEHQNTLFPTRDLISLTRVKDAHLFAQYR